MLTTRIIPIEASCVAYLYHAETVYLGRIWGVYRGVLGVLGVYMVYNGCIQVYVRLNRCIKGVYRV